MGRTEFWNDLYAPEPNSLVGRDRRGWGRV